MSAPNDDPRFAAAVELIGRTGADRFEIRYCDGHDEDAGKPPVIWIALAHWPEKPGVVPEHYDAAAGMTPWQAVFRLMEATMDGGTCRHCDKPTGVDDQPAGPIARAVEELICWYRFDPELNTFRRSCEGAVA
jgi:hypothetical protein